MRPLLFFVFLLSSILFVPNNAKASHGAMGGSIHWECHNGKYVFFIKRYINCGGITWPFAQQTISIFGNPLPRNSNNQSFSSIILSPDSAKWISHNNGVFDPICSKGSNTLSCNSSSSSSTGRGLISYFFKSDSIELNGTPPTTGWKFTTSMNDNTNAENLNTYGISLQAVMYRDSTSQCRDNSPKFPEVPNSFFCKGRLNEYSESAIDLDGDSIAYSLGRPLVESTPGVFVFPSYSSGYSFLNPLPGLSFDTSNRALILNPSTAQAVFKANSWGATVPNSPYDFYIKITAHSYRNGVKIAEVSHERIITIYDCNLLPNQVSNSAPAIRPPFSHAGGTIQNFSDTVIAGNSAFINLSVLDTNTFNGQFQNIRVELSGQKLSSVYSNNTICLELTDTLCASASGAPSFDQNRQVYYYSALASWNSFISWQTDCDDLYPNGTGRTHYFYIKASDDHCPIPAEVTKVVSITVLPDTLACPNISTSISESENAASYISFYPNPSNGLVFIDGLNEAVDYQIFNIQGKLMKRGRLAANQNQLELPVAEGLYFVSIRDESGNEKTFKLIKQ